jgi:sporulation protein YlmC with PRC-barrel domain
MVTGNIRGMRGSATAPVLRRVEDLQTYTIGATDGDIGTIADLYFDDQSWTARYVVVDTGGWLSGRKVLIPPRAIQQIDAAGQRLVTNLTRQQVEDSPGIDTERPVSRPYEIDLYGYYGYPYYWEGPYRWGLAPDPYAPPYPSAAPQPAGTMGESLRPAVVEEIAARESESQDPHLRSARDVRGHGIQATDGELGHVEDFLVDEETLAIRYLIVDPRSWWPGNHVLISTEWISAVHWNDSTVEVNVSKDAVRNAPVYDSAGSIDRDYESSYHRYYNRPGYWERDEERWRMYPPAA